MAGSYWDKITAQRVSRRRVLQSAGVAGVAAGAVAIVGCSSSSGGGKTPGATTAPKTSPTPSTKGPEILNPLSPPKAGGRYQTYGTANFDTFDPHLGIAGSTAYFPRVYNVLVNQSAQKPDFFVFDLAESYENPDELTWTFKIRPGVKIGPNDLGVPERDLTGEDVVATFDRIKNEPKANNGAFVKEFVASVTATGNTVTIKTTSPYAWFLNRVGNFVNAIPPKELLADATNVEKMRNKSAGGGPFRVVSATEGEGAKIDKNPSYYRKDADNANAALPYFDGFDVRLIQDRVGQRTAFNGGQLDQYSAETKAEADELAKNTQYFISKDPTNSFISVTMHPEKDPFTDNRARRAVALAINRKQYVDIVYQGDAKANGLVHWSAGEGTYAFTEDELKTEQPFDLAEAKKLVSAMSGLKVKLMMPANYPGAQHDKHLPIFLNQMAAADIQIEQDPQDFTTWLGNYRTLNYVLCLSLNVVYETPETPLNFHTAKGPQGDRAYAVGLNDPAIEEAVLKTKTTLEFEALKKAVRDAQKVIYSKDPAFFPLVTPYGYTAYSKKVHNVPGGIGLTGLLLSTPWIEA
ncbi:MAG: ABC transporter substrate-binding protein [Chloroflexota bacterium]|nr:ABC transporter substrate-binding protein [Chloroflexota bacterium]